MTTNYTNLKNLESHHPPGHHIVPSSLCGKPISLRARRLAWSCEHLMLHPLFTVTKKMEQSPVHLWHIRAVISAFWFCAEVVEWSKRRKTFTRVHYPGINISQIQSLPWDNLDGSCDTFSPTCTMNINHGYHRSILKQKSWQTINFLPLCFMSTH